MRYEPDQSKKFIAIGEVCRQTSLGKSCVYDLVKAGEFPKPRQLTKGRVAWVLEEVLAWGNSRPVATADIAA